MFDLDGTLTQPVLDFDQVRAEIGSVDGPILEAMERMSPAERRRAEAILERHELAAANGSQLNPGVEELMADLRRQKRAVALVTRNRRDSVDRVCRRHDLTFDGIVSREDGPIKPSPFPVLRACELMGVQPQEAILVGDYLFDLISAHRAGSLSVLLSTQKNYAEFEHEADYVISRLNEVPGVIARIENGDADIRPR